MDFTDITLEYVWIQKNNKKQENRSNLNIVRIQTLKLYHGYVNYLRE